MPYPGTRTGGRVLVGYDGRWQSPDVLEHAAAAAIRLGTPISVITLVHSPGEVAGLEGRPADGWGPPVHARRLLEAGGRQLRARHESLRVATHLLHFDDVDPTSEPFRSAVLLVLGEHGNHGVPAFEIGAASSRLRRATNCPVELVRPRTGERPHELPHERPTG